LKKHFEWENFLEVEPLESNELFRIMEAFTENRDDKLTRSATANPSPISNLPSTTHHTGSNGSDLKRNGSKTMLKNSFY